MEVLLFFIQTIKQIMWKWYLPRLSQRFERLFITHRIYQFVNNGTQRIYYHETYQFMNRSLCVCRKNVILYKIGQKAASILYYRIVLQEFFETRLRLKTGIILLCWINLAEKVIHSL